MPSPPPPPSLPLYNYTHRQRGLPNGVQLREVFSRSRHQTHKEQTKIQMHDSVLGARLRTHIVFTENFVFGFLLSLRSKTGFVECEEPAFLLVQSHSTRLDVIVKVLFILVSWIDHHNSVVSVYVCIESLHGILPQKSQTLQMGCIRFNLPNIVWIYNREADNIHKTHI